MLYDSGPARTDNRWLALITDFAPVVTKSDWGRRVTDRRIVDYDRIRPPATRGALLGALAVTLLMLPGCSPLVLVLLLPGLLQVVLEIVLEPIVRRDVIDVQYPGRFLGPMVRLTVRTYEKTIVNATGLIGAVAVLANIVAVEFVSGTAGPGWLRVLALLFAVLYCCSGMLGVVIDTPWYSPLETTPAVVRVVVKHLGWALVVTGLVASVLIAHHTVAPWADQSLPYALGVCTLGYYIGLRAREYDRNLGAAAKVMAFANADEQRFMAQEMHDYFQSAKENLEQVVESANLTVSQRSSLRIFVYDVNDLYQQARTGQVLGSTAKNPSGGNRVRGICVCGAARDLENHSVFRPPIKNRVRAICEAARMDFSGSVFDLEIHVNFDNYRLARNITTTLTLNCKQAYERALTQDDTPDVENDIRIVMRVDDPMAVIEVSDRLDLIPDDIWESPNTTLAILRRELERRGGTLEQLRTSDGKTIRATWGIYLQPILNNRTLSEGEES